MGELVRILGSMCREQGHKEAGASEEMVWGLGRSQVLGAW